MSTRTIFISAYQGFASRYLLKSGLLQLLGRSPDLRLVILVRHADVERVRRDIESDRIVVRPFAYEEIRARHARTIIGPRLSQIRQCVLDIRGDPASALFWQQDFLKGYVGLGPLHRVTQFYVIAAAALLRRFSWARRALRWTESKLFSIRLHDALFEEFKPILVVVPSLGYFEVDSYLIREARSRKIGTLGVVVNWDHTTSKGTSAALPDEGLVWGEKMRDEALIHHDMPPSAIRITGPAHYDHYFYPTTYVSREEFCAAHGLNAKRRTVLYAAMSPRPYPYNPDVVELLARICSEGSLAGSTQVFVRLHPNYHQLKHERPEQWATEHRRFADIAQRYGNVVIEEPQVEASNKETFDLSGDDARVLANTLYHADVVVCFFSTLNLEASIVDRPVINCCIYDWRGGHTGQRSRVLELSHLQAMIRSNSCHIVFTPEQLRDAIIEDLADPAGRKTQRSGFVRNEIGQGDGRAADRVATAIESAAARAAQLI